MLETAPRRFTSLIGHEVCIEWTNDPDGKRPYSHVVRSIDLAARFIELAPIDGSMVGPSIWYHLDSIARIEA